jgi:hypothetical protein
MMSKIALITASTATAARIIPMTRLTMAAPPFADQL